MRFIVTLSFSTCFAFCLSASALEVERRNERIFIKSSACSEVAEAAASLEQWLKVSKIHKDCPATRMSPAKVGEVCEFDITQCVPDHVAKFQSATPKEYGPNCWNLSLVMTQILPGMRYSTPEEMAFYMRPPLCRQLTNDEKRRPGDIGAIRKSASQGGTEIHGFIYISEKLVYSKNGAFPLSPYSLQDTEPMLKGYGVPETSQCRQNTNSMMINCPAMVSYFRCQSMDDYVKKHPSIPAELMATYKGMGQFEQCLQNRVMNREALPAQAKQNILDVSKALAHYLDEQVKNQPKGVPMSEEKSFMIGSLQLRLLAIAQQLSMSGETQFVNELGEFGRAILKSSREILTDK